MLEPLFHRPTRFYHGFETFFPAIANNSLNLPITVCCSLQSNNIANILYKCVNFLRYNILERLAYNGVFIE